MRSFKKGSFRIAIKARTPVLPLTIADSFQVMRRGEVTVRPRTVKLTIDRPIPVDGLVEEQAAELSEQVRLVVERNLAATQVGS